MNHIYFFDEGGADQKSLLGGKGANLAEMTRLGFPVPYGFTISTKTCLDFFDANSKFPEGLDKELNSAIDKLEQKMGKKFSCEENPLLVSVRSGAVISMPGMMDTVLNLGLNDKTAEALSKKTQNPRFAYDAYRRFLQMFGDVVLDISHGKFEETLVEKKQEKGISEDTELNVDDLKDLVEKYKIIIKTETGEAFPEDPRDQLIKAITAVFASWHNPRAIKYREIHDIPDSFGTAVNVQSMVFGNLSETSGTGVCFTRDPSTGENGIYGDFLMNAQGEDVVAGIRTPREITELKEEMPEVFNQLMDTCKKLENHYKDMQDIEFTIEEGNFFMLQTRSGKRTASSSVKIAVEMVNEGLITKEEAIMRIDPKSLDQLLHPSLDPKADKNVIAIGIPASPGAACGKVVFHANTAEEWVKKGEKVILVRHETSPEDINGMHVSEGILTACGGKASHAAVVARGMGTPCVAGATEVIVNPKVGKFTIKDKDIVINEGDIITLHGSTGEVILGQCATIDAQISDELNQILTWADEARGMKIRTNADTPKDAKKAREFGAEGIGLCRTEHMFFDDDRIGIMREMILAENKQEREAALEKLLPLQRIDFEDIFKEMDGLPVTIRFLDPPLHEFLPEKDKDIAQFAETFDLTIEQAKDRIKNLHEVNPMLGHRGCRLLVTYPEILKMQTRAIIEAALNARENGIDVIPEIMIPLIGKKEEFVYLKKILITTIEEVFKEKNTTIEYLVGTMIELPRACMMAHRIAKEADFFSFGTNDLTQMTFGFSRDDVAKFLPEYMNKKIMEKDPFETLDQDGVGELIKIAIEKARSVNPNLKISVCGEHGGDPASIEFFNANTFNVASCSPFRVPLARIAAAQAKIKVSK
ncbi:MAG: pyruvate, phosphate dikinase [Candidatus Gracilibacteria bacterium]|nr:pyruvate, phosphate dikinase [Candidatus Gracilibacteria bacterium]